MPTSHSSGSPRPPAIPWSWRTLCELPQPGFLGGFSLPDWLSLLRANGWAVDPVCMPRALAATVAAAVTSLLRTVEPHDRLDAKAEEAWQHPLFILGLPRSGTTHLFELLAADPVFCVPTRLDAYHPHTFLTLRRLGVGQVLSRVPVRRRLLDDVHTGWLTPEEDVLALSVLGGLGWNLRHVFPRTVALRPAAVADLCETPAFAAALRTFTRKLVHLHRKPVLLKSPTHIDWLPGILRVFPRARFVVIFRDPVRHYASLRAAGLARGPTWSALQRAPGRDDEERLAMAEFTLERYFSMGRQLIPAGSLVEIRHEDLAADEPGTLLHIHRALAASAPAGLVPSPPRTPAAPRPYTPNTHPDPDEAVRARITRAYRRLYEAGWYPPPGHRNPDGRP